MQAYFAPNGGYCVYFPQIFCASRLIFKIWEYSRIFPTFSWGIFGCVTGFKTNHMRTKILMDYKW